MSEKFISYDNLKQYDEFLDKELQDIKQRVDDGFTFNVKYAESDEIGGAAIKAVGDETGENIADNIALLKETDTTNLNTAKTYTDTKISELINSAPTTLDTLGEIADAMAEHEDVVEALDKAIGTKANESDLTSHTSNKLNPHSVTKSQVGLGNVENKSSATIRGEITKANVTDALGYTPPEQDTIYSVATSTSNGLMSSEMVDKLDNSYENTAINKATLGYQKKNIFNPNAVNWKQPNLISIAHDGTITSTITSDTRQWTYNNADYYLTLEAGTYIFTSITETGGDLTNAVINGYTSDNTQVARIYPNIIGRRDVTFTLTETTTIGFVMKLFTQTCKLMIRHADITDNVYEPYVDDVDTRITDNKNDIAINKTTLGYTKKNLFNLTKAVGSTTMSGITFTVNADKTITLNGTATATPWFELKGNLNIQDQNLGGCKYSTGLTQNADSGCYVNISYYDANWSHQKNQIVSNKDVVLNGNYTYATHSIVVTKGTTLDNVIVKPMVRLPDVTDDTYEPYVDDVDTRLKKCLPLSGGTMNNESKIKMPFNKNNDTRSMEYSSIGVACYVSPASGWASGYEFYTTEATPKLLGSIGAFGGANTFKYYYIGNDYQNPLLKVDDSGNGTFKGSVSATSFNGYTLSKSVPSNAVFTDTNTLMTQSNTNANNTYPLLLRSTAGTTTTSSSATTGYYSNNFYVNPSMGVLSASSFKTTGTQLLVSGKVTISNFNGNNSTGAKTLTASITNLSNYSSLYLELGNESDGFIYGHIPINYLLQNSANYVYLIGSFTEIDSPCAWSKVKASGNNILIDSPQYDAGHYYQFMYPLTYKIFKS